MGNSCSSLTSTAAISQDKEKPQPLVREGSLGLLDLGYQFRLHQACPKHCDATSTINATEKEPDECDPAPPTITLSCTECSIRLFRLSGKTPPHTNQEKDALVTTANRKQLIPPRIYDQVARLAQQAVITQLQLDYDLKWLPLFTTTTGQTVQAVVSRCSSHPDTLLIINGRGVARAGILSTRHTIESGIAKGSAVYHIQQALQRNMAVVCIDSNAQGPMQGLDTVCQSLNSPALAPYFTNTNTTTTTSTSEPNHPPPPQQSSSQPPERHLYILCHSAGGGNLVQHLLKNDETIQHTKPEFKPMALEQIKALAFTDSTHDLRWLSLQHNTRMVDFLQCDSCLYIRNNREHVKDTFGPNHRHQKAGEVFDCSIRSASDITNSIRSEDTNKINPHERQWRERFGKIRTVYAGTTDHSYMCYEAREVIWSFFDSKRIPTGTPENDETITVLGKENKEPETTTNAE